MPPTLAILKKKSATKEMENNKQVERLIDLVFVRVVGVLVVGVVKLPRGFACVLLAIDHGIRWYTGICKNNGSRAHVFQFGRFVDLYNMFIICM